MIYRLLDVKSSALWDCKPSGVPSTVTEEPWSRKLGVTAEAEVRRTATLDLQKAGLCRTSGGNR